MKLIDLVQKKIEALYGIKVGENATDYLIGHSEVRELLQIDQSTVVPKELFLVNPTPEQETLEIALFLDPSLQQNLVLHDPLERLSEKNLTDFCTLIEGVSHFVYYLHKASLDYQVTQLELELQAEIDKFLLLAFTSECSPADRKTLHQILFEQYNLHDHLNDEQIQRYETANNLAKRYCHGLIEQAKTNNLNDLIRHVRRFYPLSQQEKISLIMQ